MKKLLILSSIIFSSSIQANDHIFPNITGYINPYVHVMVLPTAQGELIKAVQKKGGKKTPSLDITRVEVGLMRERYDNKFANIGVTFAKSNSGDKSNIPGESDASLKSQIGFYYENGVHLDKVDLSLFLEAATASMETDDESESSITAGIGGRAMISLHRAVDLGATILFSGHYSGAGIGLKVNF